MSRMIDDEEELKDNGLIEIDGVNVARCVRFTEEGHYCDLGGTCDGWNNCYFKQLQRAKAEKQDLINYYELREGGMLEDIEYWKNKAKELYKEFEQYKKSKQASYEAMQKEWNNAVNELRNLKATDKIDFKQHYKAENERLQAENEKLKAMAGVYSVRLMEKYKQALEDIREDLNNSCWESADIGIRNRILNKINEVLQ